MAEVISEKCQDTPQKRAAAELLPVVYGNLRRLAAKMLGPHPTSQTLQATALVHEAFMRLTASKSDAGWENPEHFFAAAARAMRCILVDAHRRKTTFNRIIANGHVGLPEECADPSFVDLIALDACLDQLAADDPVAAKVIEFRFFVGLSLDQTGEALGLSRRAVTEKWTFARAWLLLMLDGKPDADPHEFGTPASARS